MEYKDFFYQAAIYLLAAVLAVPLAKRLGFGSVLGYLIAGIIIGPFVLGTVGNTESIMHFAEFGVTLMLFLIGLELRPAALWRLRSQIFGLGLIQVLATTLAFTGVFILLDFSFVSSFAIGMIFSLSSTAIVLQIFTEKGWNRSPVGEATLSVLLFQDLAIIPILAILPLLGYQVLIEDPHTLTAKLSGWHQALFTIGVIAALIIAGRFLLRPLFRFIANSNLREIFTAASLLVVIASALVMQALGLSAALGTFLAGAVLAESEYRHELEADIEPFKGLLLGIFFISVGANINFSLIYHNPILILKIVTLLLVFKAMILFAVAKVFKINTQNSLLFSLTLAQGGEFCFVLLSFAAGIKIFSNETAALLIAAVAISMLLTPLMIIFYEKVLAPYFVRSQKDTDFDNIEQQKSTVVMAGFGRFGQIIGRLLIANKIKTTVLDLDAEAIAILRQFGFKVYYGDASRMDLLEIAGIKNASLFIIAIDDSEKALEIAKQVRKHYPDLKILARVHGRTQAYDFLKNDFNHVYRETFDSSLAMGLDALQSLGFDQEQAERMVKLFKEHDEASLAHLSKLYNRPGQPDQAYINEARKSRKNLEDAMMADREKHSS
ncbi:monovalent cation:proton antiporter-2 (CPA2) family protein [Candidatus Berkiella aquae]|uniref:Glutathione-regulated potassium-efflux system protein KefC n=1 Tax=Candidatus Berkiella aquae TaxID=295108 RepID=A0A0Q9YW44_9GAMM|nr:monovalent cation:proton antiporter-2 (CPA2) family protein [Candidatus Berkiella aquae]MCS5711214.1 monovalent cation:proton antiporter-2 (CPA2) family protein [Candidatus Berkiella aquae]